MRFLADQDVYQLTVEFIASLGNEVIRVKDVGLASALRQKLILITRDNDYGALVFF